MVALYKPRKATVRTTHSMFKGHNLKTTRLPRISTKSAIKGIKTPKAPKIKL